MGVEPLEDACYRPRTGWYCWLPCRAWPGLPLEPMLRRLLLVLLRAARPFAEPRLFWLNSCFNCLLLLPFSSTSRIGVLGCPTYREGPFVLDVGLRLAADPLTWGVPSTYGNPFVYDGDLHGIEI